MAAPHPRLLRRGPATQIAALSILLLGGWVGLGTARLPSVVPQSAPATAFSAERAMHDLGVIAALPRPIGSTTHDRVRDYLVDRLRALGCDAVHVQSATGFNTIDGPLAATVANVVGRKRGMHPGPAVLLTAHYDAVPRGPGAGDDGAGVAAILETLRALAAGPSLDRDLIIVFSDAEEEGLLGAEAFVDLHPWARDVAVVLNFDARGDAGPVYMFQTSPGNGALIDALAGSVPGASANSLTGEVYRHLPSDTDLSIWLHSAYPVGALNFADIAGYTRYHTPIDDVASLDVRVVQQMGDYALGLTRQLGSGGLDAMRTHDEVYFNAPLAGVIRYPVTWAVPLSIAALVAVMLLLGRALRRGALSSRGVAAGFLMFALTITTPTLVAALGWRLIAGTHPGYAEILQHDPYNSLWYLLAFAAIGIAVAVEVQRRFSARTTPLDLVVAPLVVWAIAGLVVAVLLPGASYLLVWPLLAAVIGAAWWLRDVGAERSPHTDVAWFAVPALLLWPALVKSIEIALTANVMAVCVLMAAMVLSLLVLQVQLLGGLRRPVALAALLVAVVALVIAESRSGFTPERKRPDSLSYLVDADLKRAWWISFDRTADAWTRQVLGERPERRTLDQYRLVAPGRPLLAADAPAAVPVSPVQVLDTEAIPGGRRIHLHLAQSGSGEFLALFADSGAVVTGVAINGRALPDGNDDRYRPVYHIGRDGTILRYFGVPPDGVDLRFTLHAAAPVAVRVQVATEGLPAVSGIAIPSRPPMFMSKPFVPTDMTIIERVIRL